MVSDLRYGFDCDAKIWLIRSKPRDRQEECRKWHIIADTLRTIINYRQPLPSDLKMNTA